MFQHDIRRIALAREMLPQILPFGRAPATRPVAEPPEAVRPGSVPEPDGASAD